MLTAKPESSRDSENGNVLFIILIGIALFAALSYAVTQSGKGSGTIDKEQDLLAAGQIVSYAGKMEQTVSRMILVGGCSADGFDGKPVIDFDKPTSGTFNTAPTDCKVFHKNGGGADFLATNTAWKGNTSKAFCSTGYFHFTGVNEFKDVGTNGMDDWALVLPCVKKSICLEINNKAGVANPSGDAPVATGLAFWYMNPVWYNYPPQETGLPVIVTSGAETAGKTDFCLKTATTYSTEYQYIHILNAR